MQRTYSARTVLLDEPTDDLLLQRAFAHDQRSFEMLVHRYQQSLYRFAYRHLLDSEQAKDITQCVLLQLYLAMPHLLEPCASRRYLSLRPWLFRVARNRCVDVQRKQRRQSHLPEDREQDEEGEITSVLATLFDPELLPEELVEAKERRDQLHQAILALPPTSRRVVWLRYAEDLSFMAIAKRLGIPYATAKTYFYRACAKLRILVMDHRLYEL